MIAAWWVEYLTSQARLFFFVILTPHILENTCKSCIYSLCYCYALAISLCYSRHLFEATGFQMQRLTHRTVFECENSVDRILPCLMGLQEKSKGSQDNWQVRTEEDKKKKKCCTKCLFFLHVSNRCFCSLKTGEMNFSDGLSLEFDLTLLDLLL